MSPDMRIDDVADALRQRVVSGKYGTEGRLPSLRMLAEQFGVAQDTMNKAVQRLQAEGLLSSASRKGVFVNVPKARIPGIVPRFDLYLKDLGYESVETNIEEPALVPAPADVAKAFGVAEGTLVVHRLRRQGTTTAHYRLAENFYPADLAGGAILEQMQKDERFDALLAIKNAHGKVIKNVHESVVGRLPNQGETELLGINRYAPVLEVHRTNYAEDGSTVVMFNRIIFVATYFELEYDYVVPYWTAKP